MALDPYDRSKLTKDLPFVKDIPLEVSVNDYCKDANAQIEKVHGAGETSALHIACLTGVLDLSMFSRESPPCDLSRSELLERIFTCAIDLSNRINEYRKSKSIRDKSKSIPDAVPVRTGLFSKEGLAQAQGINMMSPSFKEHESQL